MKRRCVAVIVGTRPEAIKLGPVIQALRKSRRLRPVVVSTSQHREMVRQVFRSFDLRMDVDLGVMRPRQGLSALSTRLMTALDRYFASEKVDAVLVQGDTNSAFFGGLCAFYQQIPVGHVEAGLRSGDPYSPFPEEMNRRLLSRLATWHFAPTQEAVRQLATEQIARSRIYRTGNTVVDALRWMIRRRRANRSHHLMGKMNPSWKLVLVTCHRRENWGAPIRSIARAIGALTEAHPELRVLFPVHPNPTVRGVVAPLLKSQPHVRLCEPLDYEVFLSCLQRAWLVLSDSGGVQEEATALGKPTLVLREVTERKEGVRIGALKLVGTDEKRIKAEVQRLLKDRAAYHRMTRGSNVYGDGQASRQIVSILERDLSRL